MTDRELIEAAAKAVGYTLVDHFDAHGEYWPWCKELADNWCPLTDDGDALRLAVKLGMRDYFYVEIQKTCVQTSFLDPHEEIFYEAFKDQDPYAATRRAIVRAAAELGRLL